MIIRKIYFIIFVAIVLLVGCISKEVTIKLDIESNGTPVKHAIDKLKELANNANILFSDKNPGVIIKGSIDADQLEAEAYIIKSNNNIVTVTGGDEVGLMYGLLEIKEQLSIGDGQIKSKAESPHLAFRAIKFNLPWDSYRNSEALDLHYETCRDTLFWESFLDMMANNRFNKLTLWNLHPFNYLVKTKKYPEANGFSDAEMKEWETFWQKLFKMAKDRGIETYLINWNIFVSPEFAKAHNVAAYSLNDKYIVKQGDTSEIIKDYTRESVKEVIDKYPNLSGLGITLGEAMGGMMAEEREEWILDSYIQGMRNASRKIKFIHRAPLSANKGSGGSVSASVEEMTRRTLDTLSCVDGPITIELKFNWSHSFSSTNLIKVHGGKLTDAYWNPIPSNYKLSWMMRNEDFFVLRWGQPDFIRQHITNNVHPYVNGYFVGSETYIPAKDYFTSLKGSSYKYAFERQWMFYKNWGRLLYNPNTPDTVFEQAFVSRFPEHGIQLFKAQTEVSKVPLIIASYWNATWDFTLYSEGMLNLMRNKKMKLISLTQMCDKNPMEPNYISIKEFLSKNSKDTINRTTPVQLADSIASFCNKALKQIKDINPDNDIDLLYEVSDIRTWGYLGMYFSNKLKAAVAYQKYRNTGNTQCHSEAVTFLKRATDNWGKIVKITKPIYSPMPLVHYTNDNNKYFHWDEVEEEVKAELEWLIAQVSVNK